MILWQLLWTLNPLNIVWVKIGCPQFHKSIQSQKSLGPSRSLRLFSLKKSPNCPLTCRRWELAASHWLPTNRRRVCARFPPPSSSSSRRCRCPPHHHHHHPHHPHHHHPHHHHHHHHHHPIRAMVTSIIHHADASTAHHLKPRDPHAMRAVDLSSLGFVGWKMNDTVVSNRPSLRFMATLQRENDDQPEKMRDVPVIFRDQTHHVCLTNDNSILLVSP